MYTLDSVGKERKTKDKRKRKKLKRYRKCAKNAASAFGFYRLRSKSFSDKGIQKIFLILKIIILKKNKERR
jgi:hypothetical protein